MMSGLRHPLRARIEQQYLFDPLAVLPSSLGVVCRASAEPGGGIVVKSITKQSLADGAPALASVRRELELLRMADHPNICKVLEVHEDAERVYAVLEELSSDNLFMLPTRVTEVTESVVAGVVRRLLSAVAHLHERGVAAPLDIRPENVLFTEPASGWPPAALWDVKLVDLGIAARHAGSVAERAPSQYASPEQLAGGPGGTAAAHGVDSRADLWALGALTFTMLC